MTAIIAATPQRIARVLPWLAAVWRKEPRPGRRKSRFPSTNISQAIRKNQPPATDIMEFQTSPIVENGRSDRKSTRLNSSHGYISYAVFCLKKKKQRGLRRHADGHQDNAGRAAKHRQGD